MKTLTYERLFFLGTSYSKDGHERILISETIEDADSEEKIKELFKKVLGLHEQFDKYRELVTKDKNLTEQIMYHTRELAQAEGHISQLQRADSTNMEPESNILAQVRGYERSKEHLAEQEKRRDDLKSTILNQTAARETVTMDLRRCKESLGLV